MSSNFPACINISYTLNVVISCLIHVSHKVYNPEKSGPVSRSEKSQPEKAALCKFHYNGMLGIHTQCVYISHVRELLAIVSVFSVLQTAPN